ncbi:LysR family transcriptional regulator [Nonomuraea deserti]|uniref:LysR family transcriptional regulator n=1 Tax=Nonomuraea deserti TaxID=1848322 RepID=UPI001C7071BB
MSERNATRTGQRIGMSQAAVSGALSRVRTVFHDPLFVRAPGGLAPTPRVVELAGQIRPALAALADVICDADAFDPTARPPHPHPGASPHARLPPWCVLVGGL